MNNITFKLDRTKLCKYIIIALLFLIGFGYVMFNANALTSEYPSGSRRYNWVGVLFYQKPKLLFTFSLIINLIVTFLIIDLLPMLVLGKLELSKKNGVIYRNGKYFIEQKDILKTEYFESNKNSAIFIYLKSNENVKRLRESFIERIQVIFFLLFNKNKIQIRLTFLKESKTNYKKVSEFLKE